MPAKETNRLLRKKQIFEGVVQPYNAFSEFFNGLRKEETGRVRSSALELLWRYFPPCSEHLAGKVGNADDPGDGLLYDGQQIEEAKSILRHLHHAWSNREDICKDSSPPNLPDMAMICLILTGMQHQHLLEDFLDKNVLDKDLPMKREEVEAILVGGNREYAFTFYTEQHRAVPRKWYDGIHMEMEEEEPLPFMHEYEINQGSYGMVIMVKDPLSGARYARKQQLTSAEEQENAAARNHLEEETKRLKGLRHKHIVQLVNSYTRGRAFGILLKPAATSDLERLILRYYDNKFDAREDCKPRKWLRPIFLNAFGCLSIGLAYIHRLNIRHKDVKPANILYERAFDDDGPRLLWADFGLAYDFTATGNSKTRSTKVYSQRYAAPEIIAASSRAVTERRANIPSDLDRIVEDGEEMVLDAQIESAFRDSDDTGHGRKTDIFSLGCVFLELLACLVDEKLPMDRKDAKDARAPSQSHMDMPREVQMFSQHIDELKAWAQRHENLRTDGELIPLLKLTIRMISLNPEHRPLVHEIVNEVADAGPQHFCNACWQSVSQSQSVNGANGTAKSTAAVASPSPRVPLDNRLERVNPAPRRHSVGQLFDRASSITRPQYNRFFSRDVDAEARNKPSFTDIG